LSILVWVIARSLMVQGAKGGASGNLSDYSGKSQARTAGVVATCRIMGAA
jgi:hypothetical protein